MTRFTREKPELPPQLFYSYCYTSEGCFRDQRVAVEHAAGEADPEDLLAPLRPDLARDDPSQFGQPRNFTRDRPVHSLVDNRAELVHPVNGAQPDRQIPCPTQAPVFAQAVFVLEGIPVNANVYQPLGPAIRPQKRVLVEHAIARTEPDRLKSLHSLDEHFRVQNPFSHDPAGKIRYRVGRQRRRIDLGRTPQLPDDLRPDSCHQLLLHLRNGAALGEMLDEAPSLLVDHEHLVGHLGVPERLEHRRACGIRLLSLRLFHETRKCHFEGGDPLFGSLVEVAHTRNDEILDHLTPHMRVVTQGIRTADHQQERRNAGCQEE